MIVLLVAALLLVATPAAGFDLQPRSVRVSLGGGWDSNLLDASDAEVRAFESGDPGSFFVVRRMADAFADAGIEGRWSPAWLSDRDFDLRLGYQRIQYLHEVICSSNRWSADARVRLGETRLRGRFDLRPHVYLRHRRDKDALPGDAMFRAETQNRVDGSLGLLRPIGVFALETGVGAALRDEAPAFRERDRRRVLSNVGASWTAPAGLRVRCVAAFERTWSRNEPYLGSDLSSRDWSVTPSLEDLRLGAHARLRLSAAFHRTTYTSGDPGDAFHFGRSDRELLLGTEAAGPIGRALSWFARYQFHRRTGSIPDIPTEFDDEGSLHDHEAEMGTTWEWRHPSR